MVNDDDISDLERRVARLASELAHATAELRRLKIQREAELRTPEERRRRFLLLRGGGIVALISGVAVWLRQHRREAIVATAGLGAIAVGALDSPPPAPESLAPAVEAPSHEGVPTHPPLAPVEIDLAAPEQGTPDAVITEVDDPATTEPVVPDPPVSEPGGEESEPELPGVEEPEEPAPPGIEEPEEPGGEVVSEPLVQACLDARVLIIDLEACLAASPNLDS